jgi:small nuclear ribonucleoprotein (snRNP)-like protein
MNIVLGGVEEVRQVDDKTGATTTPQTETRKFDMLFVRGDSIILAAPPSRLAR